jgi:hypothetical protein
VKSFEHTFDQTYNMFNSLKILIMKQFNLISSLFKLFVLIGVIFMMSCTKEGPIGPKGDDGTDGKDGKDAVITCGQCHNPSGVEAKATEFELSKHSFGEAAFEEAGNTTCAPCHSSEGFKYVIKNNVPATYVLNSTTGKYSNSYVSIASKAYGDITCNTCHSSLHNTYGVADYAYTTTDPVPLTMYGGTKTVNLTADGGKSNLCVRCHQPRPFTNASNISDGNLIDYASLSSNPTALFYDSAVGNAAPNKKLPTYRFHVHYGTVGAVYAGVGGVEFTGSLAYTNSYHTANASCQDCHMAGIEGRAGGHTFVAKGNFNGCNTTACHGEGTVTSSNASYWTTPRSEITALLNQLADKINAIGGGQNILHSEKDVEANLWAGTTTGNFDGYLDIYSSSSNPSGYWRDPANTSSANMAKPKFPSLTNAQVGALLNFQFALREYSRGIHNYKYVKALLTNTIAVL